MKRRKAHVESDGLGSIESHGFVGQSDIREGRVEGMVVVEGVESICVEGGGVEILGRCKRDGVEIDGIEGHQSGVGLLCLRRSDDAKQQ